MPSYKARDPVTGKKYLKVRYPEMPFEQKLERIFNLLECIRNHPRRRLWKTPPKKVVRIAARVINDLCVLRRKSARFRRALLWLVDQDEAGWPDGRDEQLLVIEAELERTLDTLEKFSRVRMRPARKPPFPGVVRQIPARTTIQEIGATFRDLPFDKTLSALRDLVQAVYVIEVTRLGTAPKLERHDPDVQMAKLAKRRARLPELKEDRRPEITPAVRCDKSECPQQ